MTLRPSVGGRQDAVVFWVLFCLGFLQHSLRTGLAASGHGPVLGYYSARFYCSFWIHGRSRPGFLARWSLHREEQERAYAGWLASLCADGVAHRCICLICALRVGPPTIPPVYIVTRYFPPPGLL